MVRLTRWLSSIARLPPAISSNCTRNRARPHQDIKKGTSHDESSERITILARSTGRVDKKTNPKRKRVNQRNRAVPTSLHTVGGVSDCDRPLAKARMRKEFIHPPGFSWRLSAFARDTSPTPSNLQQRTELARGEQLVEQFFIHAIVNFEIADVTRRALRGTVGNRDCAVLGRPFCPPC
jgi:hypothetical protein